MILKFYTLSTIFFATYFEPAFMQKYFQIQKTFTEISLIFCNFEI